MPLSDDAQNVFISKEDRKLFAGTEKVPSVLKKVDKWGGQESMGEPVGPTKFIPMKTPFSKKIVNQINIQQPKIMPHILTVEVLLMEQRSLGREVGMIFDLTDHECLYAQDIPEEIEYQQVRLVAKQFPDLESIRLVPKISTEFWHRNPDKYIAIHCAYGLNRTGFVLCSYLIEMFDMSVQEALDHFQIARSPGIRHEKFIQELHLRYGINLTIAPITATTTTASSTSSKMDVYDIIQQNYEQGSFSRRGRSYQEVDNESLGFDQGEVLNVLSKQQVQLLKENGGSSKNKVGKRLWDWFKGQNEFANSSFQQQSDIGTGDTQQSQQQQKQKNQRCNNSAGSGSTFRNFLRRLLSILGSRQKLG
eukprot:TRINITY_DN3034_c0_g2_i1.p1 TRINITY_DN3034_c0_g2~~TRINITY_DN3034_c0_g2_i1.p1  ORF type:complete len:363 (-),score=41.64 TRINITY_DN3034_c0_g2_i1:2803-3891(-)